MLSQCEDQIKQLEQKHEQQLQFRVQKEIQLTKESNKKEETLRQELALIKEQLAGSESKLSKCKDELEKEKAYKKDIASKMGKQAKEAQDERNKLLKRVAELEA